EKLQHPLIPKYLQTLAYFCVDESVIRKQPLQTVTMRQHLIEGELARQGIYHRLNCVSPGHRARHCRGVRCCSGSDGETFTVESSTRCDSPQALHRTVSFLSAGTARPVLGRVVIA